MECIYLTLLLVLIGIIFFYHQNNVLTVTKINIKKNIIKPIKIAHLSDIHGKEFGENSYRLVNKICKLKPDLIVATGDVFNMDGRNTDKMIGLLGELNNISPVYYIFGNHEHRLKKLNLLEKKIKSLGVNLLIDEIHSIKINGNIVNLLGLDENQASKEDYRNRKLGIYEYKDYSNLFSELESRSGLKIVLSHYPENFSLIGEYSYKSYKFDLMMSGHAHGGQFRLPFIGGLYARGQGNGIFPRYTSGLYEEERSLIVSRGIGPSRFPFRLFNRPEIVILKIY